MNGGIKWKWVLSSSLEEDVKKPSHAKPGQELK